MSDYFHYVKKVFLKIFWVVLFLIGSVFSFNHHVLAAPDNDLTEVGVPPWILDPNCSHVVTPYHNWILGRIIAGLPLVPGNFAPQNRSGNDPSLPGFDPTKVPTCDAAVDELGNWITPQPVLCANGSFLRIHIANSYDGSANGSYDGTDKWVIYAKGGNSCGPVPNPDSEYFKDEDLSQDPKEQVTRMCRDYMDQDDTAFLGGAYRIVPSTNTRSLRGDNTHDEGILSGDCAKNSRFCNHNRVRIAMCQPDQHYGTTFDSPVISNKTNAAWQNGTVDTDGDGQPNTENMEWSYYPTTRINNDNGTPGDPSDDFTEDVKIGYHFLGRYNFIGALAFLKDRKGGDKLADAHHLILSGSSGGGMGLIHNANFVAQQFSHLANQGGFVGIVLDSKYPIEQPNPDIYYYSDPALPPMGENKLGAVDIGIEEGSVKGWNQSLLCLNDNPGGPGNVDGDLSTVSGSDVCYLDEGDTRHTGKPQISPDVAVFVYFSFWDHKVGPDQTWSDQVFMDTCKEFRSSLFDHLYTHITQARTTAFVVNSEEHDILTTADFTSPGPQAFRDMEDKLTGLVVQDHSFYQAVTDWYEGAQGARTRLFWDPEILTNPGSPPHDFPVVPGVAPGDCEP